MTTFRQAAQQALEALDLGYDAAKAEADQYHAAMAGYRPQRHAEMDADVQKIAAAITALKAALAESTVKESLHVEPAVAENATTQQQLEDTPPSDYRRGYWDGFAIGKREGRIEAEDALAEPVVNQQLNTEPVQEPLPFGIEERAGVRVLFSKDGSCRPASDAEWMMWCALVTHGITE